MVYGSAKEQYVTLVLPGIKYAKKEQEQYTHRITAANDGKLIKREEAESKENFLITGKRGKSNENPGADRGQQKVNDLHGRRILGQTRDKKQKKMPERRMALIPHIKKKLRDRSTIPRKAPGLGLIMPQHMMHDAHQAKKKKDQDDHKDK